MKLLIHGLQSEAWTGAYIGHVTRVCDLLCVQHSEIELCERNVSVNKGLTDLTHTTTTRWPNHTLGTRIWFQYSELEPLHTFPIIFIVLRHHHHSVNGDCVNRGCSAIILSTLVKSKLKYAPSFCSGFQYHEDQTEVNLTLDCGLGRQSLGTAKLSWSLKIL